MPVTAHYTADVGMRLGSPQNKPKHLLASLEVISSLLTPGETQPLPRGCPWPHLDFLRLHAQVAGRLHGPGPAGEPVGDDGREGTDAHQRRGRQVAEELAEVIELGEPQAPQDFLSLHLLHERNGELCKSQKDAVRSRRGTGTSSLGRRDVLCLVSHRKRAAACRQPP